MIAPLSVLLAFLGLVVSANTKLHTVILGHAVICPVLWLIFAALVLTLATVVLVLLRLLLRDGLRLRPMVVNT